MPTEDDICVCGVIVRPREHVLLVEGREIELTSREFEILERLAEHPGWVFSASQLSDEADDLDYSPESVSVHVSRLRHKLARAGAEDIVETVRGAGYRLRHSDPGDASLPVLTEAKRKLRDAAWGLHEAALEAEHAGDQEQLEAAVTALDEARHALYRILAG